MMTRGKAGAASRRFSIVVRLKLAKMIRSCTPRARMSSRIPRICSAVQNSFSSTSAFLSEPAKRSRNSTRVGTRVPANSDPNHDPASSCLSWSRVRSATGAGAVGGAVDCLVVDDHGNTVGAQLHVGLDELEGPVESGGESRQGVLRSGRAVTPVAGDEGRFTRCAKRPHHVGGVDLRGGRGQQKDGHEGHSDGGGHQSAPDRMRHHRHAVRVGSPPHRRGGEATVARLLPICYTSMSDTSRSRPPEFQ